MLHRLDLTHINAFTMGHLTKIQTTNEHITYT